MCDGIIWTLPRPARHHHIVWVMNKIGETLSDDHPVMIYRREQGFIDDKGTFFNRIDAAVIAKECKQLLNGKLLAPPRLFSEDLW